MEPNSLVDRAIEALRRRGKVSVRALGIELGVDGVTLDAVRDELVDVLEIAEEPRPGVLSLRAGTGPSAAGATGAATEKPARPGAERRLVTFLLCDVVSSTPLAARLDPEDLRDLMLRYQEVANAAILRHGGHVSQWIGDGAVVYFGYPEAHEDDTVRALRTALEIVEGVDGLDPLPDGTRLQCRVGVHAGPAVVGDIGAGDGQETLAFGETPNVCARIESAADPGTVFVSEPTVELAKGYFEFEDRGLHELKGVARPVRLFRVLTLSDAAGRFDAMQSVRGVAPLVGRDGERATIEAAWSGAAEGRGSAILVVGEPGIGKSRLAYEARELAEGHRRLQLFCTPYDRSSALQPVVKGLATMLELEQQSDDAARRRRIDDAVRAAGGDPTLVGAWLAELLRVGGTTPPPPDPTMTPQRRRTLLLQILAAIMLSTGSPGDPLLLVVEDAHWIDPTTEELLGPVITDAHEHSILVLITARPDYLDRPSSVAQSVNEVVALEPVAMDVAVQLARTLLDDDETARRVASAADGVPLFVEELAYATRSGAQSNAERSTSAIPTTLQATLQARLDGLSPDARGIAQFAAAIGRSFDLSLVRAARPSTPRFEEALFELEAAQILRPGAGDGRQYEFRHALVQEAAASTLLRADARAHHLAIANVLLDWGTARPEIIARHLTEGGSVREALLHWQLAGISALERSAMLEAIDHFESALGRLAALPPGSDRDGLEVALQVLHAVPLTLTRGFGDESVRVAYSRAAELCETLGPRPELFPTLSGLLTFDIVRARIPQAVERARANLRLAEESGDDALIVVAEADLCAILFYAGEFAESVEHGRRTVEHADPEHQHSMFVMAYGRDPVALAEMHHGLSQYMLGDLSAGRATVAAAVARCEQWHHPFTLLWAKTSSTLVEVFRGDVERVLALATEVMDDSIVQGFPNWMSQAMVYRGWAIAQLGDLETGLAMLREGQAIWAATGSLLVAAYFRVLEAQLCEMAADHDGARQQLDIAWQTCHEQGDVWVAAEAALARAEVERATGNVESATEWYERARAAAVEHASRFGELKVETSYLAFARLHDLDVGAAAERLRRCLAAVDADDGGVALEQARAVLAMIDA